MALSHREGRMRRHLNSSTDGQLGQGTSEAKLSKEKEQQPRGEEQHIHLHRDGQAERVEEGNGGGSAPGLCAPCEDIPTSPEMSLPRPASTRMWLPSRTATGHQMAREEAERKGVTPPPHVQTN